MSRHVQILLACALVAAAAAQTQSARGSGRARADERAATYTNPVFDQDFPDPTVLRASDGYYYAYAR